METISGDAKQYIIQVGNFNILQLVRDPAGRISVRE